ncbi:MAG: MBL fold metallo-hydrolase [Nitrospinae bacterium]|nr:MBL fold metallo-hydrolase [Nitrospinota bacterium]MBL7020090.1 MBL fold metallo-hydrolase [Nitrospinaceae bacterium]
MFLQRYYLECLSHASYMVADEKTKVAVVIDPRRDIDIYVEDARAQGFKIKHVILTHFHADFVAGHIELRDRVDAQIYLGTRAKAEFDFKPIGDGSVIEFGDVRLEAMETPGHTPEGITILAYDKITDLENPYAIFTGDTLFLGDVGRPDLFSSIGVTAHELAEMLYDSLQNKLLKLPDETLVYPAHGAGSMCGKALSDEAVSTLGEQRLYNYALQPMSKENFIKMVTADQPEAPAYFGYDATLNQQERPNLDEAMKESMKALDLNTVLSLQKSGAQIVDVRDMADFAGAHLRGSLNIGIEGKFATWAGTLLNKDVPIIIIAEAHRTEEAVMRLGRIGFHNVKGYLKDGMESLKDCIDLISKTQRISAVAIYELEGETTIVDIRNENEWKGGHIEGSINIPLNHLADRIAEVPESGQVIVHCQGGYRSMIAASLLEKENRSNIFDLVGGYQAWVTTKRPVIESVKLTEN